MRRHVIHLLIVTDVVRDKLGARAISAAEVHQLPRNEHATVRNPRDPEGPRVLLIGQTDGGRSLTLVVERTADPGSWLIVTGWDSTVAERKITRR